MPHFSSDPKTLPRHKLDASTVGLWRLNGNFLDAGPNALHLTEVGTVPFQLVGKVGYVAEEAPQLELTKYASHPYDAALDIKGAMTFMCLIHPDSFDPNSEVFGFGGLPDSPETEARNFQYFLKYDGSGQLEYIHESGAGVNSNFVATGGGLVLGRWNHAAFTRSGTGVVNCYINGSNTGTSSALGSPTGGSSATLWVGTLNTYDIEGPSCEYHLLDREMSSSEISAIANNILAGWGP